jgi:acyl-CoA synthetase (NDP forming)
MISRVAPDIQRILNPASIALVGISGDPDKAMSRPLRYLTERGYAGAIYPVNPRYTDMAGLTAYADLSDIPGSIDLVLSFVSAARTPDVVRAAARAGAAGVIVFASGFAETDAAGTELQSELARLADELHVRILGPNCQGLYYEPSRVFATFTGAIDRPLPSANGIAYVGQSGAVGGSVLDLTAEMGIGLTAWVSTGNQVDIDHVELADALLDDPHVRVIMIYAEGIRDGRAFTELCRKATAREVQLILLRTGRSESGRRAAASHTGSMLGDDAALSLVCRENGVVLVDDIDQLIATAVVAAAGAARGRRLAIVTTSGGAGGLAADHSEAAGLRLAVLDEDTTSNLATLIPSFGAVANPVDVTAEILSPRNRHETLGKVCRLLTRDNEVDVILIALTMVTGDAAAALAQDIVRTGRELATPLFVGWMAGHDLTSDGRGILAAGGIPVFPTVSAAIQAIGRLVAARDCRRSASASVAPDFDSAAVTGPLLAVARGESDGSELLDALGVGRPRSAVARTEAEAAEIASHAPGSLALKIHAQGLLHKSDIGGVRLSVTPSDVPHVFTELLRIAESHRLPAVQGVLIQDMIPDGVELLVSLTSGIDGFPPILTIGAGGVNTEIYKDVVTSTAPLDADRARRLLQELRCWPLLEGFRGADPADIDAAATTIANFSRLAHAAEGLDLEVEINPIIVAKKGEGVCAADILVNLGTPAAQ